MEELPELLFSTSSIAPLTGVAGLPAAESSSGASHGVAGGIAPSAASDGAAPGAGAARAPTGTLSLEDLGDRYRVDRIDVGRHAVGAHTEPVGAGPARPDSGAPSLGGSLRSVEQAAPTTTSAPGLLSLEDGRPEAVAEPAGGNRLSICLALEQVLCKCCKELHGCKCCNVWGCSAHLARG